MTNTPLTPAPEQEIEKAPIFARCRCYRCLTESGETVGGFPITATTMVVCDACGNKRCPHATDHRFACTASNAVDQLGSRYAADWSTPADWRLPYRLGDRDVGGGLVREAPAVSADGGGAPIPDPGGWRGIESAPKDGTAVLTFGCLHEDGLFMGERAGVQLSRFGEHGWFSGEWGSHKPTHWRPLPDPPVKGDG